MSGKPKTACVVVIGNEILTGRTQDTNLGHIARKLLEKGVRMMEARIIADIEEDIITVVNEVRKKYDYIFTTGGIGPTHDDITADSIAKAFGVKNVLNADARARLVAHYQGEENLNEGRLRMAHVPQGASLIDNPVSTAPGFKIGNVHVMAGIPRVMQAMLDGVLPTLQGGPPIKSRTVNCMLAESFIAADLGALAREYSDLEIGSYPYYRMEGPRLSLVVRGSDIPRLDAAQNALCALIIKHGGQPEAQPEGMSP